jgi:hypothetical protein
MRLCWPALQPWLQLETSWRVPLHKPVLSFCFTLLDKPEHKQRPVGRVKRKIWGSLRHVQWQIRKYYIHDRGFNIVAERTGRLRILSPNCFLLKTQWLVSSDLGAIAPSSRYVRTRSSFWLFHINRTNPQVIKSLSWYDLRSRRRRLRGDDE